MTKSKKQIDYGALKTELDETVQALQDESLSVDEAIVRYKRGLEIVTELETYLKTAENTIKKMKSKNE